MLTSLGLFNFKSYTKCQVPLGPLTIVVGTNASGKSNLRDALKVLHGIGLGYTLPEILGDKYGPGGILQWRGIRGGVNEAATTGKTVFGLYAATDGAGVKGFYLPFTYKIRVAVENKRLGPRVVSEAMNWSRNIAYQFNSHPSDDPVEQKGDHTIRVRYPRGGNNRKHGKTTEFSSSRAVVSQIADSEQEPTRVRRGCQALVEIFRSIRFLDLDPDAMRQASQPGQIILGDRGENLSSVLQEICGDSKRRDILLSWVKALTPMDAVDFEFPVDFSGRVLVHLVESNGSKVSAFSASDGTLRFLAMIAALLSPDSGRIYFFEEFDNGIHPTRLHLLLQLVQQACVEQNVQVIGTTHNPALLSFLDEDARNAALLVYREEGTPESKVRRIAELPDVAEILESQDLGRLHASGWLEDAAAFSEPDSDEVAQ